MTSPSGGIGTVFLDRDGVINRDAPDNGYITRWEDFEFLPRVIDAMRLLRQASIRTVIVTNQRGIARGLMTEHDLERIHARMQATLRDAEAQVDEIYYCPDTDGPMRKPEPGMLVQAATDNPEIDFAASAIIGDSLRDMVAGDRVGCRTILVADGPAAQRIRNEAGEAGIAIDAVVPSLYEAVTGYLLP